MTEWLRQSTSVTVMLGPFLDATTANTDQTTLTITQPDIRISKNGGAWAQKAAAQTLTHAEAGWYGVTLDATDTNTLGRLKVAIHESPALNVWESFMVVTANVWDSLFGSALQDVNVVNAAGTAWNSGAIGAATLAADTLTAAKVAADVSTEFATTFFGTAIPGAFGAGTAGSRLGKLPDVTAGAAGGVFIAGTNAATAVTTSFTTTFTGNLTGSVASVTGAVGSVTGSVGSVTGAVGSVTGAVGSVTGLTASNLDATVSSRLSSAGYTAPPSAATISTAVWTESLPGTYTSGQAGYKLNAAGSGADPWATALPGAYGAGTAGSRLGKLPDVTAGASGGCFIAGTNAATSVTTSFTTTFTGNLTGSVASVTGEVGSVTGLTASNLDATVSSRLATAGYTTPPTAAANADAVWDEATSGHTTAGTYGQSNTIVSAGTSPSGSADSTHFALVAGASATDNFYNSNILVFTAGPGAGQARVISGYVGSTKVCAFVTALRGTLPTSATEYMVVPADALSYGWTVSTIGAAVWNIALPGAYGAGTAGNILGNNVDAAVSSRLATAGYTTPPTSATNATAVWSEALPGAFTSGQAGYKLNAAGAAGDPWATLIPGAYGAGTAGSRLGKLPDATAGGSGGVFIAGTNAATTITTGLTTTFTGNLTGSVGSVTGAVGSVTGAVGSVTGLTASNLDTTISSRASQASVTTVDDFLDTEISAIQTAVTTTIPGTITTLQSSVNTIDDFLDTEIAAITTAVSTTIPSTITTLQADTDNIQTRLPTALVSGRMDASVGAVATDAIDANALAASAVDEILDEVVEGTYTLRQLLRLTASALASKVSGADTTTITFRDISDTKNRIVATVDGNGNRSSLTIDVT